MRIFRLVIGTFFSYKTWNYRVGMYIKMLELLEKQDLGFCAAMDAVEPLDKGSWIDELWRLPELYWHKPRKMEYGNYWFYKNAEGMEKRRKILKKIIDEYRISRDLEKKYS